MTKIPWDRYEVALLFSAYERTVEGSDINTEAAKLSEFLRGLAVCKGLSIDETYRNVNGMKMQLANVQYLFTGGKKGLSGASAMIHQMYELYKTNQTEYQTILKEAIQLNRIPISIENAFFIYAKDRTFFSPKMLTKYLRMAADYCHLKEPLLGMTDTKAVHRIQQKVATGKLLRFHFGKDAQNVRNATQLYYSFVKDYQENSKPQFIQNGALQEKLGTEQIPSDAKTTNTDTTLDVPTEISDEVQGDDPVKVVEPSLESTHKTTHDIGRPTLEVSTEEWILTQLKVKGLTYQDKRAKDGCLWILGGHELDAFAQECKDKGYIMTFKADGCRIYPECPVWWTKTIGKGSTSDCCKEEHTVHPPDGRWLPILQGFFPDGYILDDFLSQFQASAYWQERYGEDCPMEGALIDQAMKSVGSVRDGRVFAKNDEDNKLISDICEEIIRILSQYTTVYRSCIYERYREQLATCSIYTESVMTQQLLDVANGGFYSTYQVFAQPGQESSVIQDCRKVLRNHGGSMNVSDVAKELWFIPYDTVYHNLTADSEALNIGTGVWMLAEHFPVTIEDAAKVGDMLDKCFLRQDFVQQADLMPLLREHLPFIADNLSGLHFAAIFNILNYHLKNRFSFSKAIIAPKGAKTDFRDLFQSFAKEHDRFTLDELSAFAAELQIPIYWENTFIGGAVRISETEFVNRKLISFDVDSMDKALESFCPGDYLPLQDVSSAMMMHLPSCGYHWNGYLLLSYVYGFSNAFRLFYNSLGKTGYYGAMVKRSCKDIDCYNRLVERILTDDDTWTTESEALDMLVKKGLQAQRRFRGIDQRVAQARQNKLSDRR